MRIIELDIIRLFEGVSKAELIKRVQDKREKMYMDQVLSKMHELIQQHGDRQSIGGYAFDISRYLGGAISPKELEQMYRKQYMNESQDIKPNSIIDNKRGWGAVPNNQEVDYLGLRVSMSPKTFISLAAPLDREPSEEIVKHLQNDGKIGSPFLIIEIPESWEEGDFTIPARVVGHEGRNRMLAITNTMGNIPIETHLFFSQGLRNRHITDSFKKNLNKWLFKEKSKSIVRGPLFSLTESMLEWGRVVKGVNTTVDVGPEEIKSQAAKYGNTVDKDGFPPKMTTAVKTKSTTVKHHKEEPRYTAREWAIISGGHTLEETVVEPKKRSDLFVQLENFADGKVKGKSRPGRVKRAGASCNGSVTDLRKRAKNASGEKAKMYHWCANMKSGRKKK